MIRETSRQNSISEEPLPIGWDDHRTARYYDIFSKRHGRYRKANRELIKRASLSGEQRVLDFAAGTGATAEAALSFLDERGSILCFEPSAAMRAIGEMRLRDTRITWTQEFPVEIGSFTRILCGAAIWQLLPLSETLKHLSLLLQPGGALCFNIPSLYLGEADEPGGGDDPFLLELPSLLAKNRVPSTMQAEALNGRAEIEELLDGSGFRFERWTFRLRFTQRAYRDWLKIPVITNGMLCGLDPDERARRIDAAFRLVDQKSWRWERWTGWTAWKAAACDGPCQ